MTYQTDTERRLGQTVEAFFAGWHPVSIDRGSTFNDRSLLAEEEATELVTAVCSEFSIDEDEFYKSFPFRTLFENETSPLFAPIGALLGFKKKQTTVTPTEYTIAEFAQLLKERFAI